MVIEWINGLNEFVTPRILVSLGFVWLRHKKKKSETEYLYFEIISDKQSIKQYHAVKWGNLFKVSSKMLLSKLSDTVDAFCCASYGCYCYVTQ